MLRFLRYLKINLIILPIIRLAYKLDLFVFKRALKLRLLLNQKIRLRIRYIEPNARLEGYDEELDLRVNLASLRLLSPEIFDDSPPSFFSKDLTDDVKKIFLERKDEYVAHKNEVDNLVAKIQKDEEVSKLVVSYNLVRHFAENHLKNKVAADYYLSKAQKVNSEAAALKTNDLFALERSLRKDINELTNEIADRQAIKISLSLERAGTIISLVSCLFVISGYLNNRFVLGYFGIEVSKYFTIGDYLASSIEVIRFSATGAAIGIIALFLGAHRSSRKSYAQVKYERSRKEYYPYLIFGVAIIGTIRGYLENSIIFYDAVYVLIIFSSIRFSGRLASKYFKEPFTALFLLVFVSAYSAHMFSSVGKTIHRAKNAPLEEIQKYEIQFKNGLPISGSELVFLAGNSNYLFLLDHQRKGIIVPREQVLYFKVKR